MLLLPVQMQSPGSSPPLLPPSQPQTSQEIKEALQAPAVNVHLLTMASQFGLSIHSLDFKVTEGSQGGAKEGCWVYLRPSTRIANHFHQQVACIGYIDSILTPCGGR